MKYFFITILVGIVFNKSPFHYFLNYKNIAVVLSKREEIPKDFKNRNSITFIKVTDVRLFVSKVCEIIFRNSIKILFQGNK